MHKAAVVAEGLKSAEEILFRQKSRIDWLACGDSNTKFFHSYVKAKQSKHTIRKLIDEDGKEHMEIDGIAKTAVGFYKNLLGTVNKEIQSAPEEDLSKLIRFKLPENNSLCAIPSDDEIRKVFFNMPKGKSPGPDGFPIEFYIKAWPVIDVMKSFRPIACCNVLYKGISKLLANKMSEVLPSVISRNQSAFVKGRLMGDNIMLAHELVKGYNRARISPRATVKIDLMKAFDSVNWDYLFMVMKVMNFPPVFVGWIKASLQTAK
ncbi:Transposon TX1 uncharacterized 149 kDa protein, partial [Linum perenne]